MASDSHGGVIAVAVCVSYSRDPLDPYPSVDSLGYRL